MVDNRPGSQPEIKKLPRHTCERCLLSAAAPIVEGDDIGGWYCTNLAACRKRGKKLGRVWALDIEDL